MKIVNIFLTFTFAVIVLFATTNAMPATNDNRGSGAEFPSTPISTSANKKSIDDKAASDEFTSISAAVAAARTNDNNNDNNNDGDLENSADPEDSLEVAEQRRFRFPYRRRLQRQKEEDLEFPALF